VEPQGSKYARLAAGEQSRQRFFPFKVRARPRVRAGRTPFTDTKYPIVYRPSFCVRRVDKIQ
jgi:hypothetical protein